jgi:hypothetical protein
MFLSSGAVPLFLRLLHVGRIHKDLGPLLVMVQGMVSDISSFIKILVIVMVAFGVALEGLGNPLGYGNGQFSTNSLAAVVSHSAWRIFGDLFLSDLQCTTSAVPSTSPSIILPTDTAAQRSLAVGGSSSSSVSSGIFKPVSNTGILWDTAKGPQTCMAPLADYTSAVEASSYISNVMVFVYMLFTNILLVNLLIAMMSDTYARVKEVSYQTWRMEYYRLLREYSTEHFELPPPLNILTWPHDLYALLRRQSQKRRVRAKQSRQGSGEKTDAEREDEWLRRQQRAFAKDCQLKMLTRKAKQDNDMSSKVVLDTREITVRLQAQVHELTQEVARLKTVAKAERAADRKDLMNEMQEMKVLLLKLVKKI